MLDQVLGLSPTQKPRPAIFTFAIILLLTIGIVATLMICHWLMNTIIADSDLQALKNNYPAFTAN